MSDLNTYFEAQKNEKKKDSLSVSLCGNEVWCEEDVCGQKISQSLRDGAPTSKRLTNFKCIKFQ